LRVTCLFHANAFRRACWRGFQDAINGPMLSANYGPVVDANRTALINNGVKKNDGADLTVADTDLIRNRIDGRRNYLSNGSEKGSVLTIDTDARFLACSRHATTAAH
jgi:hypothetical protein